MSILKGNTCYMNSTIQVLGRIPELRTALTQYGEGLQSMNPERRVVAGLRDVYAGLDRSGTDYPPLIFWQVSRSVPASEYGSISRVIDATAIQAAIRSTGARSLRSAGCGRVLDIYCGSVEG